MKRISITADEKIIRLAERLAADRKMTVSQLFSRFIASLDSKPAAPRIGPKTRKLTGVAKLPANRSYKQFIREAVIEKHKQ
jgi:hypothetical protein